MNHHRTESNSSPEGKRSASVTTPDQLGAAALTQLTDHVDLRGPEPKNAPLFDGASLIHFVGPDQRALLQTDNGIALLDAVVADATRIVRRSGIDAERIDKADLLRTYGHRLTAALQGTRGLSSKGALEAYRKLVVNNNEQYITTYFSDKLTRELMAMAANHGELAEKIPTFFSTAERVRQAKNNRYPLEATRQAVSNTIMVLESPDSYGLVKDSQFFAHLRSSVLLEMTTRYPNSYANMLPAMQEEFAKLTQEFPLLAEHCPWVFVRSMVKHGGANIDMTKVRMHAQQYQESIDRLLRSGHDINEAIAATETFRGENSRASAAMALGFGPTSASFLRPNGEGKVARRHGRALEAGRLTPPDVALARTLEDREAIYDIDEADVLDDQQKRRLYEALRSARNDFAGFTVDIEPTLGHEICDELRTQFSEALTNSIYAIKYCIDHPMQTQTVPMGSKDVAITGSMDDMLHAVQLLGGRLRSVADIGDSIKQPVQQREDGANVELGHIGNSIILTKARRESLVGPVERGRSARINISLGGDVIASAQASEREQTALSIRFDLSEAGILQLDIGGKTDNPYTPDFMVAKLISLGGWYKSQLHGHAPQDYHRDIVRIDAEDFARRVEQFREAITYSDRAMNVPHVSGRAPVQAQAGSQTRILHQVVPAEKSVA